MGFFKAYLTYLFFSLIITSSISGNSSWQDILIISLVGIPFTYIFEKFSIPQKINNMLKENYE